MGDADQALAALENRYADSKVESIASVYACQRKLDKAFAWLDRAYRQRDGNLPYIKFDPRVRYLPGQPRASGSCWKSCTCRIEARPVPRPHARPWRGGPAETVRSSGQRPWPRQKPRCVGGAAGFILVGPTSGPAATD